MQDAAHVAIAYEGVAAGSADEAAAAVLANIVGAPAAVKWGSNSNSNKIGASLSAASADSSFSAMNQTYTDSGLFGVYITAPAAESGAACAAVTSGLRDVFSGNFSDEDVAKAKNQAVVGMLDYTRGDRSAFVAKQCLSTKQPLTPEEMADKIAAVSAADVRAVAAKIGATKATFAAAGNLAHTP